MTFFYDYFPPAYKAGGPIQSLWNLSHFLKDAVPIKVVTTATDHDGSSLQVPTNDWTSVLSNVSVFYAAGLNLLRWVQFLRRLKSGCLYINGMYSFRYNLLPLVFCKANRIVIAPRGMLDKGSLSTKSFKKKLYLHTLRFLGVYRGCIFHASSEAEVEGIRSFLGSKHAVKVVSNVPKILSFRTMPTKSECLNLVTVALISPMKNHALVLEALCSVNYPIKYHIYGPIKDRDYWNACKAIVKRLPQHIKVEYHGDIQPELVADVISQCHVYIQPSQSENFGHSLFEALSLGRPVITSHNTPWNNLLTNKSGINVTNHDTSDLIKAICHFAIVSQRELADWGKAARTYAEAQIDLKNLKEQYLDLFGVPCV
ncbi:MAG TPA: hypothetical protein DCQ29_12655 [Chitinophagaceae bacterium]|nr:hypothetical protein [Chitinophagaceae bacterium]